MSQSEQELDFLSYPDEEEIRAAVRVCCGCNCSLAESPVEYAWRKRRILLGDLLNMAIAEILTDNERTFIRAYYYDGLDSTQISRKYSVSPQYARASISRAEKKLKQALGYAIMYINDTDSRDIIPLSLRQAAYINASRKQDGGSFGERLRQRRVSLGISLQSAANALGMNKYELKWFEQNKMKPDTDKLKQLCIFYSAEADTLLGLEKYDREII